MNTGAPQGAQFFLTFYTNESKSNTFVRLTIKLADDTAIMDLIQDDDEGKYREWTDQYVGWCKSSFLHLNIKKTKEMIWTLGLVKPTNNWLLMGRVSKW